MRIAPVGRFVAAVFVTGVVAALAAPPASLALETDQFTALARPLADSTEVINAKINLEITGALDELQRPGAPFPTCDALAVAVRRRLKWELFQPIELWASQSPLVGQSPARGEEAHTFVDYSIYRRRSLLDVGMWMPLSPTIEAGGFRFGVDKLAHMVSSGWKYRDAYLRRIRRGDSEADATRAAIRWGVFEERGINGSLVSGVFSRADLEADYQGMRFYLSLCAGPDPILAATGGRWRFRRPFDIRDYVTPEWDESYHVSVYTKSRWRKIRPQIDALCPLLDDPSVRARFVRYRRADATTPTEALLAELEKEGKLPDSSRFALEAVCPQATTLPPPSGTAPARSPPPPGAVAVEAASTAELEALEADRSRRGFMLWRTGWTHLGSLTAAVGGMFPAVRRTDDCRSLCDLRGPTIHVELGLTSGRISGGWGRVIGETDRTRRVLADVYLAYGLRATLVRTWRNGPLEPSARTLVGAEAALTIARVAFTVDLLHATDGAEGWVVNGGLGLGF